MQSDHQLRGLAELKTMSGLFFLTLISDALMMDFLDGCILPFQMQKNVFIAGVLYCVSGLLLLTH